VAGTGVAGAAVAGGIGIGAVAAIVAGGAAVAGVAVAARGHGGGNDTTTGGPSTTAPSPGVVLNVSFGPPPGLDVSVCVGHPLGWSSQVVVVPGGVGMFDTTWSPSEPNVLRVSGSVTDTAFNANISCTSGAASGTLTATGSGGTYQGSFALGSQRGPITVTRN